MDLLDPELGVEVDVGRIAVRSVSDCTTSDIAVNCFTDIPRLFTLEMPLFARENRLLASASKECFFSWEVAQPPLNVLKSFPNCSYLVWMPDRVTFSPLTT